VRHTILRLTAGSLLAAYCCWQVFWLARGRIPPALFLAVTGLPAPTSGGTRGITHLLRGDWRGSLHHNPMAVPLALLFGLSVGWLLVRGARCRRWRLPRAFLLAWAVLLALAWVIKLAQYILDRGLPT
jgi:hypothetical protein